jgi:hypothetical protein
MTRAAERLEELERLLNDPEVPMDARRVWELLAEICACLPRAPTDEDGQ